jgi:hypothetical protein
VLQGAARRFVPAAARAPRGTGAAGVKAGSPAAAGGASMTALRRKTAAALRDALGETRLHRLRAAGEAMDDAHAVAYALEAISRAGRGERV